MQTKSTNFIWQVASGLTAFFILAACSPEAKVALPPDVAPATLFSTGAVLYEQNCATCHQGGDFSVAFPALKGSATVAGNPSRLIGVILKGQQGISLVDGKKLNGIMPAQGYLTDLEVAAISTFVRKEFAQIGEPVQPSEVAAARK